MKPIDKAVDALRARVDELELATRDASLALEEARKALWIVEGIANGGLIMDDAEILEAFAADCYSAAKRYGFKEVGTGYADDAADIAFSDGFGQCVKARYRQMSDGWHVAVEHYHHRELQESLDSACPRPTVHGVDDWCNDHGTHGRHRAPGHAAQG